MFHTSHIHVPRNRRPSALRTFIASSSFGPPDTKEPLRRGILLTAVAFVLLLIGSILTWLGFNDVFGGNMSMTGPLLIALSLLLLLLSFRQFLLARKRNTTTTRSSMQLDSVNRESMTAVVVNRDDGLHPSTVVVDRYNRIGYDGSITVHRHWEDDCAPPSYQEVTRFISRSNTPSCMAHDDQDELPPTYEETMCSTIYTPPPLIPPPLSTPTPAQSERSQLRRSAGSEGGEGQVCGHGTERGETPPSSAVMPQGGVYPHLPRKPSSQVKTSVTTELELEMERRVGPGVSVRSQSMSGGVVVVPLPQHSLAPLPHAQHMSAPASPRQLSAPPSPHPFSAPPSPRQLSPRPNLTPPPQYMSPNSSCVQLSTLPPPSLHMLSASPSHTFSRPSSPHFSAPSSPHPVSGQHSLTPPPQYTSCPPSPRQVSAPASPLLFSPPRSPCFMSGPLPAMHPLSPQPPPHHPFPPPPHSFSHQLPDMSQQMFPLPSLSARTWAPSPQHARSQDGYTCFRYNFVSHLPEDASLSARPLQGHPAATFSHFPRESAAAASAVSCPHPVAAHSLGEAGPSYSRAFTSEGRPGFPRADVQTGESPVYGAGTRACIPSLSDLSLQRDPNAAQQSSFTSRTDIQANI